MQKSIILATIIAYAAIVALWSSSVINANVRKAAGAEPPSVAIDVTGMTKGAKALVDQKASMH